MTPKKYITTRTMTLEECNWLPHQLEKGTVLYKYTKHDYGCCSPNGTAMCLSPDEDAPFYEIPNDAFVGEEIYIKYMSTNKDFQDSPPGIINSKYTIEELAGYIVGYGLGPFDGPKENNQATIYNALSCIDCPQDGIEAHLNRKKEREKLLAVLDTLSARQIEILDHTVHCAANRVFCGSGDDVDVLVDLGLMVFAGARSWAIDKYYTITEKGFYVQNLHRNGAGKKNKN